MDRTNIWFLGFVCIVVALLEHNTVQGKCKGKWAIHACRGGNGKRSDPSEGDLESAARLLSARRRQFLESLRGLNSLSDGYGYAQDEALPAERLEATAIEDNGLGSMVDDEEAGDLQPRMLERGGGEDEDEALRDAEVTSSLWRRLITQLRDSERTDRV